MKTNFLTDQWDLIGNCIDLEIKKGICAPMVRVWIKRELNGEPQSELNYNDLNMFASLKRAMNAHYRPTLPFHRPFKSEDFNYIESRMFHYTDFIGRITPLMPGIFVINIFATPDHGHCIGVSILNGKYKFFDPNVGEFEEVNKKTGTHPLSYIYNFFKSTYCSSDFQWMRIVKFTKN